MSLKPDPFSWALQKFFHQSCLGHTDTFPGKAEGLFSRCSLMPLLRGLSVLFLMKQKAPYLTGDARKPYFMQGVPEITSSRHALSIPTMRIKSGGSSQGTDSPAWTKVAENPLKSQFKEPESFRRSCTTISNTPKLYMKTGQVHRTLAWLQDGHRQTHEGTYLPSPKRQQYTPSPQFPSFPDTRIVKTAHLLLCWSKVSLKKPPVHRWPQGPLFQAPGNTVPSPSREALPGTLDDIRYFPHETLSSLGLELYLIHL